MRKIEIVGMTTYVLLVILLCGLITLTGCKEKAGIDIINDVIITPDDEKNTVMTNGEIKQPESTPEPNPEKPEKPKPTVAINTVVQADDKSVTISGTSTAIPEGAKVTIVLGDDAITVKTKVNKDGSWTATVPARKTARLSPGTIMVKATAKKVTAESSFEIALPPIPEPHKNDFVGLVSQTLLSTDKQGERTYYTGPVAGVTLTVTSGERAGEQSMTDKNGNYRFSNPARETTQLRLRVEKEGYEPKKVIVHRSQPTETLAGGVHFSRRKKKTQETPGTILIGHRWPDKVRFILEETLLPHDLLLLIVDDLPNYAGLYSKAGVVVAENTNCLLKIIAHELGHAHQHAVAVMQGNPTAPVSHWETTPSGRAYLEARAKDWEEVGKMRFYDKGRYLALLYENMAEVAKEFWNIQGEFDNPKCFSTTKLAEEAPNRFRWAQEWLSKKY